MAIAAIADDLNALHDENFGDGRRGGGRRFGRAPEPRTTPRPKNVSSLLIEAGSRSSAMPKNLAAKEPRSSAMAKILMERWVKVVGRGEKSLGEGAKVVGRGEISRGEGPGVVGDGQNSHGGTGGGRRA
ncbi:MAG: hypothetical protein AAGF11_54090 [Myxococcota bacterium]